MQVCRWHRCVVLQSIIPPLHDEEHRFLSPVGLAAKLRVHCIPLGLCGPNPLVWRSYPSATNTASATDRTQLQCLTTEIPASACGTFTNDTCICTDTALYDAVIACAEQKCNGLEQLSTTTSPVHSMVPNLHSPALAKLDAEACNKPKRERRDDIAGFVFLESFAVICLVIRIYVRLTTMGKPLLEDIMVFLLLAIYGMKLFIRAELWLLTRSQ
jgi:hypothetical protein